MSASQRRSQQRSDSRGLRWVAGRCQSAHVYIQAAGPHHCHNCSSRAMSAARDGSAQTRERS
eukprot:8130714-Alexandrium_andersonii.AAC.1